MKLKMLKRLMKSKKLLKQTKKKIKALLSNLKSKIKSLLVECRKSVKMSLLVMWSVFTGLLIVEYLTQPYSDADLLSQTSPYVVQMFRVDGRALGSGSHIQAPSGTVYLLTNRHVCQASGEPQTVFAADKYSSRPIARRIIEIYWEHDLCLVEALPGRSGLTISDSEITEYQMVYSVGHPLGLSQNYSSGFLKDKSPIKVVVSMLMDRETCQSFGDGFAIADQNGNPTIEDIGICYFEKPAYNLSVFAYPGSSGSALLNTKGELVGVIYAGNSFTNWGSAVPLEYVKDFLRPY